MPHAYVGVQDKVINYLGTSHPDTLRNDESGQTYSYDETFNGRGKLLMPGLYNAHSHVPMTLLRGIGENMPLDRWLNDAIFPFEALMTDEDVYYATLAGIGEMLRFGVVSCTDMYYHSEARARAIIESLSLIHI